MSSNLFVFTTGKDTSLLRESAKSVNITLHEYPNPPWTSFLDIKLRKGLVYLSQQLPFRKEELVMWVDGDDSLILKPEHDIVARYMAFGGEHILMSAENSCWPDETLASKFPEVAQPRYLCAGGFIGPKNLVMAAMAQVIMDAKGDNDQLEWTRSYLAKTIHLQLDHTRRIFANISDGEAALKADSCVKHWNGKLPGRKEYWDERKSRQSSK